MAITASTYNKIQSIKEWATAKLPTVTEENYASLLTDLLKYLDSLIKNNDLFETDLKAIIAELNKLINADFPTTESINEAINNAKSELNTKITTVTNTINTNKTSTDKKIADLTGTVTSNKAELNGAISNINTQLNAVPTTIQNKLKVHTDKVKKDITDALTNVSQEK